MNPHKVGGPYQFTSNQNYEDYSSGRVLYGATGSSNFPVRLVSEIFQRAVHLLKEQGNNGPYTIYDPFCGAGYSLTILGLLHGNDIQTIFGSDVNSEILEVTKNNLSLLSKSGLQARQDELQRLYDEFQKDSHKNALESLAALNKQLPTHSLPCHTFRYDALGSSQMPVDLSRIDLIITDLPYGKLNAWEGFNYTVNPGQLFLKNLHMHLKPQTIIAISLNKKQDITHDGYTKIKSFKVGIRKILFLQKAV